MFTVLLYRDHQVNAFFVTYDDGDEEHMTLKDIKRYEVQHSGSSSTTTDSSSIPIEQPQTPTFHYNIWHMGTSLLNGWFNSGTNK